MKQQENFNRSEKYRTKGKQTNLNNQPKGQHFFIKKQMTKPDLVRDLKDLLNNRIGFTLGTSAFSILMLAAYVVYLNPVNMTEYKPTP